AFYVRTNAQQPRYIVVTKEHSAAYECIPPEDVPATDVSGLEKDATARLARYRGARVGKKLSHVRRETIAGVIELSGEYMAAGAIDLLLRRANIDPQNSAVTAQAVEPRQTGPMGNWLIVAGGEILSVMCHKNGSALLRPRDAAHLATDRADEVKAHVDR